MEKKLTAQGPEGRKSFTVTLPKDWVISNNLHNDRHVQLDIIGNKVVVSPSSAKTKRAIIIGKNSKESLYKILPGLYRLGVEEIKFFFPDAAVLQKAIGIIERKLIGYQVVEQTNDYVIIKDFSKEIGEEFQTLFRRVFILILELAEAEDSGQVALAERNAKRLINYCQRILMKKGHSDFKRTPLYYLMLDRLEKLGDEFVWLSWIKLTKKKEKDHIRHIRKLMRKSYELFYNIDARKYNKYQDETYTLMQEIYRSSGTTAAHHLHNLARIINSLSGDIFMLVYDE